MELEAVSPAKSRTQHRRLPASGLPRKRSPLAGIWHPAVARMQWVAAGALVGRVTDPFGRLLHEARAPFAGEILYVVATPPVSQGEPLAGIGRLVSERGARAARRSVP